MFKLVVLSALLAAAAAKPDVFFTGPLAPTTYVATVPAATTYLQSSSYYPAPTVYSSLSNPHFIKKRSAPFYTSYVAPSTYLASSPLATTYSAVLPSASYYSAYPGYAAGLPFIKK
ncbi:unnamed protein product, partial [Iphiclides podalirius]